MNHLGANLLGIFLGVAVWLGAGLIIYVVFNLL